MRVYNRQFNEAQKDYQKVWTFLIDDYADKQEHFIWTIGRFGDLQNSLSRNYYFPFRIRENLQLWLNMLDELVGFAVAEYGTNEFFILAKRGHEFIYYEMIEWVKNNWNDREGCLTTWADEIQCKLMRELERTGFQKKPSTELTRKYDLQNMKIQEPPLPDGIVIKDMFTCPNIEGDVLLNNNAWRDNNEVTSFDIARAKSRFDNPCYFPHLDIYAENKDGLIVAGCNAFTDYKNNYAEIEMVRTHRDYRRLGLAQAVIGECMRRLRDEGINYAYIGGDYEASVNLYGKFEHVSCRNWFEFTL